MNLNDLKDRLQTALGELRAVRKKIGVQRTSIANAGYDAGGDPNATAALTAARVETLRELEREALAKISELRAVERETRAIVAGGLGVALSSAERAEAAQLAILYPDQAAALDLSQVQTQLQAAVLHEDRAGMFFWGNVGRSRLTSSGPVFGGDTRSEGHDQAAGVSRGVIASLVRDVDEALRDRSADPVMELTDKLRSAADDLRGRIDTARANRGEGPTFGRSGKVVRIPDQETYDATGYDLAG